MKSEYLDRASRIATDNVSSAQQILMDTLDLMSDYCRATASEENFFQDLRSLSTALPSAQAQMAALSNVCKLIIYSLNGAGPSEVGTYIDGLKSKVSSAPARAAVEASKLVVDGGSYVTLSQSEYVLKAFEFAAGDGKLATVYVMESRPLFEGRQTARMLRKMGHRAILISDASPGLFVKEADAAFAGADAILGDGTLVNKIGTYPLAALCSMENKPFYAVTSVLKFDSEKTSEDFVNKQESAHEIFANPEFEVANFYFDRISPRLVTAFLTEAGVFSPATDLEKIDAAMRTTYG